MNKVILKTSLLALTALSGLFFKNQVLAVPPRISVQLNQQHPQLDASIVSNFYPMISYTPSEEPGVIKISIIRNQRFINHDYDLISIALLNISKYIQRDTRKVKIYLFSPTPYENNIQGVEYFWGEHWVHEAGM